MTLWLGWFMAGPVLFPDLFPVVPVEEVAQPEGDKKPADKKPADAEKPTAAEISAVPGDEKPAKPDEPAKPVRSLPAHATKSVALGSMNHESGYGLQVELSSVGAAIRSATLNDPRYVVAENLEGITPLPQLQIVGTNLLRQEKVLPLDKERKPMTFDLAIASIDDDLATIDPKASLKRLNWELVSTETDEDSKDINASATFRVRSADGQYEVTKKYVLNRLPKDKFLEPGIRDADAAPYSLDAVLTIKNLGQQDRELTYVLQGPVGLPLENPKIARKYRDIKAGFLTEKGALTAQSMTSGDLVKATEKNSVEEWSRPFRYLGVDVQYFVALVVPSDPQLEKPYFELSKATVVAKHEEKAYSDISFDMKSKVLTVPQNGSVEHRFKLYFGPKREELLDDYEAGKVFDYGWFGAISDIMVKLMRSFHGWGVPYGLAIVMLTVIVRALLFPLSKKQAASGKKMKDLQPLLNEIKEKYKDDKQELAKAQMELYRKAKFNPFGGCVLVFFQLPIFISLYQALSNCVDLRMASFLYIKDLSAPDALFQLPFALPFFGIDFNLLPILTTALFFLQQKMFMPPPANEEAAMQMKMMNFMTIFFGAMFYHVPAGLCVYFIASSLWGMTERKIIEMLPTPPATDLTVVANPDEPPKEPGFLARMMKRVQDAAEMQQQLQSERKKDGDKGDGKSGSDRPKKQRPDDDELNRLKRRR